MKKALLMLAIIGSAFIVTACAKEEGSKTKTTTETKNPDGTKTTTEATDQVSSETK